MVSVTQTKHLVHVRAHQGTLPITKPSHSHGVKFATKACNNQGMFLKPLRLIVAAWHLQSPWRHPLGSFSTKEHVSSPPPPSAHTPTYHGSTSTFEGQQYQNGTQA